MSMTNPDSLATKADLHEMYGRIYPFLEGGGSGGSGGHTIEDSTGNPLTQRDTMQFSDSFALSDDSTNEATKIGLNKLGSGEIDDIVTPLPSVQSRYHEYSTEEHIVGKWIDGSYIYEKTYYLDSLYIPSGGTSIDITNFLDHEHIEVVGLEGGYYQYISGGQYKQYHHWGWQNSFGYECHYRQSDKTISIEGNWGNISGTFDHLSFTFKYIYI